MNTLPKISAAAVGDAHTSRPRSDVDTSKKVTSGDHEYRVFGCKGNPITGFHARAYRNSHHNGQMVTLASPDDLDGTQPGCYFDVPAGAQPPKKGQTTAWLAQ